MIAFCVLRPIELNMTDAPKHIFYPSIVIVSQGIRSLPQLEQAKIFSKLWSLNIYAPDTGNGLQDNSGVVTINCHEVYWKIEHNRISSPSQNPKIRNIRRTLHIRLKNEGGIL